MSAVSAPSAISSSPSEPLVGAVGAWLTTTDHKKIGIMYGIASFFFLIVGGSEALLIRMQLAVPGNKLLSADLYNQVFTMHGVTKPVTLKINRFLCKINPMLQREVCGADAEATINRADFGVSYGQAYGFDMTVTLRIQVEGVRQ